MIIPTGEIQIISIEGGGFDHGRPVKPTSRRGEPVPANIRSTVHQVYDTGSQAWVTREGYSILIDREETNPADIKRIAIIDSRGRDIGEFEVEEVLALDYVNTILISV